MAGLPFGPPSFAIGKDAALSGFSLRMAPSDCWVVILGAGAEEGL